ncbi:MAG TPA: cupin domain-containing protein [Gaiellaceae bacterium]|jgi:mannose-6-phosphate isomerase-like protein (cupin superfamily)|nr:cupin domain-containing protein [Gaiellaceae bacterium]
MAIIESFTYAPFDESDPDDFRPNSRWALLTDPGGDADSHVDNIALIFEEIAVGDCIPLHVHPIHEVIVIDDGVAQVTLGRETRTVGRGTVVFIPAGTPHGTRNSGVRLVRLHAMFPSEQIGIEYLQRNPAPGTEDRSPQPAFTIDARALAGA